MEDNWSKNNETASCLISLLHPCQFSLLLRKAAKKSTKESLTLPKKLKKAQLYCQGAASVWVLTLAVAVAEMEEKSVPRPQMRFFYIKSKHDVPPLLC